MVNKLSKKIAAILILCMASIFAASCQNLPQKAAPAVINTETSVSMQTDDTNSNLPGETVPEMIQNPVYEEWVEPAAGPTVTPIVLGIEKRGEEGAMIIRTPYPETDSNVYSQPSYTYEQNAVSNPISNAVNQAMRDEMELINFNPVSGAVVLPGQALHLDVTLKNTGTTTWQTSYKVIDVSAAPMSIQKEYNLPYAVAPGGSALLSIYMAAGSGLGRYTESFQIQDAYGAVFGSFEYVLEVGDFSYVTSIPTLTATITPTYYSAEGITATPDSLAWMCIDPERSKLQDCYSFCVEYSDRDEFRYCFYNGERYLTPVPENQGG